MSSESPDAFKGLLFVAGVVAGIACIYGGLSTLGNAKGFFDVAVRIVFGPLLGVGLIRGSWAYLNSR